MTEAVIDAQIWPTIRAEAHRDAEREPCLAGFLNETILRHHTLMDALGSLLAHKLASPTMSALTLLDLAEEAFERDPLIAESVIADLQAIITRDPATRGYSQPLLYFKGFHAIQAFRIAHHFWVTDRTALALFLQSRISEVVAVDIHPGARIGRGIMFDHATSVVIGETAVIEDDFSMLHEVTLGGTGKAGGDRHPKVGRGVMIGAGSVVLSDVAPFTTVAGVPAKPVGYTAEQFPALDMDQTLECEVDLAFTQTRDPA